MCISYDSIYMDMRLRRRSCQTMMLYRCRISTQGATLRNTIKLQGSVQNNHPAERCPTQLSQPAAQSAQATERTSPARRLASTGVLSITRGKWQILGNATTSARYHWLCLCIIRNIAASTLGVCPAQRQRMCLIHAQTCNTLMWQHTNTHPERSAV